MSVGEIARNCESIVERGIARMEREQRHAREARKAMRDAIKKTPVQLSRPMGAYAEPADTVKHGRIPAKCIVKLNEAVALGYTIAQAADHAGCGTTTAHRYMGWIREGKV